MRVSHAVRTPASNLFVSSKTSTAIPTSCSFIRDALVQASLDPQVRSIEFIEQAKVGAAQVEINSIVIARDDGRYLLDVVPARRTRERLALAAIDQLGLPSIVLTAADIRGEPRFANSRLVWSYRQHPIGIGLRLAILQTLIEDGPMTLARLLSSVRSERDPSPSVMALACLNLLELDLVSGPLGPLTIARYRP
jgi:hypothetical protein